MRRSPRVLAGAGIFALMLVLSACASPAPQGAGPSASAPAGPTPTPTIEPIVIGPAEMPPAVFDGDCAAALSLEDIAEVIGPDPVLEPPIQYEPSIDNAGGLRCSWSTAGGARVDVGMMPRTGLDGAEIPADLIEGYFVECDGTWVCSWQGGDDEMWVSTTFQYGSEMTRASVDEWGESLGQRVMDRYKDAAPAPWVRDRSTWWPTFDCAALAQSVGAQLGMTLVGSEYGFEHRPAPVQMLGILASREATCRVEEAGGGALKMLVSTVAGQGAELVTVPDAQPSAPIDLGVPGIEAQTTGEWGFALIDGVNRADLYVYETTIPLKDLAVAVAAAAASDFQP